MTETITIQNLFANYENKNVLKNVNLSIPKGEITTIIGPNGSGKSTLLKCIAKQMKCKGQILLDNKNIDEYSCKELAQNLSYLKQSRDIPMTSVESLVLHGRFPFMGFPRKLTSADKEIARNAMIKLGVWALKDKELCELSGGECQKVYLAMLLTQNAKLLLLDEPTTYLDIKHQLEILQILCQLKAEGQTIVTVLHDINSAMEIADNICVISDGEVLFFGTPKELLDMQIIETAFGVKAKLCDKKYFFTL